MVLEDEPELDESWLMSSSTRWRLLMRSERPPTNFLTERSAEAISSGSDVNGWRIFMLWAWNDTTIA